ncbi:MAG: DUF6077 domain-containing protein [Cyanobacteria bacterium P01_G01_bin.38]
MKIFLTILQVVVQFFSSWTVAYHFSLSTRLPTKFIHLPFLCVFSGVLYFFYKDYFISLKSRRLWPKGQGLFVLGTFFFCLLLGGLTLFISRPNGDDFSYFHRVLVQLENLDQPFFLGDTSHNMAGLPALSLMHVMTSYEPLVGLAASGVGLDPLWVYQNLMGLMIAALFPITYILLYKQLGLSRQASFWAAIAASLFLFLDGNVHRSFGNYAFVQCWKGKAILTTLLIPMAGLFCVRFLRSPSWRKFILVAMVAVSGVGLSGSGIFMIPLLIFAIGISYGIAFGNSWRRWEKVIVLSFAAFYPVGIAIAFKTNLLPQPSDISVWVNGWPNHWWQNLQLVIGDTKTLVRNLWILLVLPWLSLSQLNSRFWVGLSIVLSLMFVNPFMGPVWLSLINPGAYWRLAYLFPLPLCAGLIVSPRIWRKYKQKAWLQGFRIGMITIICLSVIRAYQFPTLPYENVPVSILPVRWKMPGEYKFIKSDVTFSQTISNQVSNKSVLASERMIVVLGLINPTVRFEATRAVETLHIFRNFEDAKSIGANRVAAQKATQTCKPMEAFWQSLDNVDALIINQCPQEDFGSFLEQLNVHQKGWKVANKAPSYTLFLRQKTRLEERRPSIAKIRGVKAHINTA